MPKEFIIRGQTTVEDPTEVLNMSHSRPGYGFVITEFQLYPSTGIGVQHYNMMASITADNASEAPDSPNFNNAGLIAVSHIEENADVAYPISGHTVINDLFVITQDLILMVVNKESHPVNWQVKFKEVKLSVAAEAVANFKQYTIYNTSS